MALLVCIKNQFLSFKSKWFFFPGLGSLKHGCTIFKITRMESELKITIKWEWNGETIVSRIVFNDQLIRFYKFVRKSYSNYRCTGRHGNRSEFLIRQILQRPESIENNEKKKNRPKSNFTRHLRTIALYKCIHVEIELHSHIILSLANGGLWGTAV